MIQEIKEHISPEIMLSFHLTMPFPELSNDDLLTVISECKDIGIDLLSIGYPEKTFQDEEMTEFIDRIKTRIPDLPLILHGDFDVKSAESVLRNGQVDFIGFEKLIQEDQSFPQTLR